MRTAINSAARLQRVWGVAAGRGRLGGSVRIHGDFPELRLEAERRMDFRQTLAGGRLATATAFDARRPLVARGVGRAASRVCARSRRG